MISPDHAEFMLLPRLAAMSEVQWLKPEEKNYEKFLERLPALEQFYRRLGYKFCPSYE